MNIVKLLKSLPPDMVLQSNIFLYPSMTAAEWASAIENNEIETEQYRNKVFETREHAGTGGLGIYEMSEADWPKNLVYFVSK